MAGSGRIYQRAGIYFVAYSHGGREARESSRSRNLEDAQRLLASRIVDRPVAHAPDAPRVTFDDLTRLYLEEYEVRQFRGLKTAKQRVRNLRPFFESIPASSLNVALVRQFQALRVRQSAAAASVNRETSALKRMCRLAAANGLLASVPMFPESLPKTRHVKDSSSTASTLLFGVICRRHTRTFSTSPITRAGDGGRSRS